MSVCRENGDHWFKDGVCVHCGLRNDFGIARTNEHRPDASVPLPSVCRWVHYYGRLEEITDDFGPFAALVVDVTESMTVTLKITDRQGRDHVRANVKYGDPGWMWPPRVG